MMKFLLVIVGLLLLSPFAHSAEFSVSATSHNGVLTIVPNTCDKVKFVKILTDPLAPDWIHYEGTYKGHTDATTGRFQCVVCSDRNCTPIDVYFEAEVISGIAPLAEGEDLTLIEESDYFIVNHPFILLGFVIGVLLCFYFCSFFLEYLLLDR